MVKHLKPVQLFLALGLASSMAACGSPSSDGGKTAEDLQQPSPAQTLAGQGGEGHGDHGDHQGGEGGEGGEGASTGNSDIDYMTSLALMQGHLIAAQELMEKENYEEAAPHIGHPVEELYGGIEAQLQERKIPEFKSTLNQLNDLIKSAPTDPKVQQVFQEAEQKIAQAMAAVPDTQRQSPEFGLQVINEMLKTAAEEYKASIADGKIVEAVEYQDSRGFVLYAQTLYDQIAEAAKQNSPQEAQDIAAKLDELEKAWPSIEPPNKPVKTSEEVYGLVGEIELASSSLTR